LTFPSSQIIALDFAIQIAGKTTTTINTPGNFELDSFSKKRINKWLSGNSFSNSSTLVYNDLDEEEGIIHYVEEIDAHRLALGTHGRTGLGRLFSGSLEEHVVNHAKRPIRTYHIG